jgi:two-component sensor histidine kinase
MPSAFVYQQGGIDADTDACFRRARRMTSNGTSPEKSDNGAIESGSDLLLRVRCGLALTADVSRADVLLFQPHDGYLTVLAHAMPRSISSLYKQPADGRVYQPQDQALVMTALRLGRTQHEQRDLLPNGAPVDEEVWPIVDNQGQTVAVLSILTNMIEYERQRHRNRVFQRVLRWLKSMAITGDLRDAESLSPFAEWDGILYIDEDRTIGYVSGIAMNLYRRLGYLEDLRGKRLPDLHTGDDALVVKALQTQRCLEEQVEVGTRYWTRKAIPLRYARKPLFSPRGWLNTRDLPLTPAGALLLVHDATEHRRRERELIVKSALIKEVHHRVKNNLQSVASLLRIQARRINTVEEARQALADSESRVLSIGVIHEFLSRDEGHPINIREVSQRIIEQVKRVAVTPEQDIVIDLVGPNLYLSSGQATACALAINELLSNAIEHGYGERPREAHILLILEDGGDFVHLQVDDDGPGLPPDFDIQSTSSLGLQIVRTLIEENLKGTLQLRSRQGGGASAIVEFPKAPLIDTQEESFAT